MIKCIFEEFLKKRYWGSLLYFNVAGFNASTDNVDKTTTRRSIKISSTSNVGTYKGPSRFLGIPCLKASTDNINETTTRRCIT